jgi:hypothetical protein
MCAVISRDCAKCNAPDGYGTMGVEVFSTGSIDWGLSFKGIKFCNPYHHALGIDTMNNAR